MATVEEIIQKISEQWFLREPAFFALYCLQHTEPNPKMACPVRVGRGRLEYHPTLLATRTLNETEQLLRIELIRLFLKHPYERQPQGVSRAALALASDVTIADHYPIRHLPLTHPDDLNLPSGECYEWYARRIEERLDHLSAQSPSDESQSNEGPSDEGQSTEAQQQKEAADRAELWEEDDLKSSEINNLIKSLSNWGSIPGNIVELIQASTRASIDYRLIMQGFRGTILSSHKKLTRMKPNRRTAFNQMGTMHQFTTRLLVAVDVSGSISDSDLANFYGVINKMFRYGIEAIDCVQFDCTLGPIKNIRRASRQIQVTGRGGTSFQPVFDYLHDNNYYDGLIILTDGMAPHPTIHPSITAQILWVCNSQDSYNACHQWMELTGRCCWMVL